MRSDAAVCSRPRVSPGSPVRIGVLLGQNTRPVQSDRRVCVQRPRVRGAAGTRGCRPGVPAAGGGAVDPTPHIVLRETHAAD